LDGYVPEPDDDWRDMRWALGPDDPDEEGISDAERRDRIRYLDEEWWPTVLEAARRGTKRAQARVAQARVDKEEGE
jgi:hypothetical protein